MPVPLVAGNWKMNTTIPEAVKLASELRDLLEPIHGVGKVLCPPFVSLEAVGRVVEGSSVLLGAQNMYHIEKGAYTGEVSPTMLAGLCRYVILGHSERRQLFDENDEQVNLKVKAAFESGLMPIVCVGETLDQREAGRASEVVGRQMRAGLDSLHYVAGLVVAYEPVWAIGTGVAATPETASEIMGGVILPTLEELFGRDAAAQVPMLYGGSVTGENVADFISEESVHGALVGGPSLRPDQFAEIVKISAEIKASS